MNKDQWRQIEKIFYSAMELPPGERDDFVGQACAGEEELRQEVQALLAANRDAASFLDSPVAMPTRSGTLSPTVVAPRAKSNSTSAMESGIRVGHYRLLREIGRGGMGAVWLAERADGQFRQQVAIKLLHAGAENEEISRRFRHERQILAGLDHPNIARLHDGGTNEDGRPYFVMEHIEGLPIDEYCRQHQLSVDDRLRLFRQVCAAVHYAHQHLVIHRDLKPGNIVVTEDGAPKLLDFGIAKLIQPDLSRSYDTLSGVTPMTPAYASPEQVRGEKLTTASDVYSLGVVLYELLTGRSPYRLKANTFGELMRAVIEQEPERPSTAITRADDEPSAAPVTIEPPDKLRRRLAGDIDSIALMALRKEPSLRYGSVEQFSEDIRRYLDGLPTLARRGTFGYRALKYIRRNKVTVAAAVLILLSLLGGIGATLRQARIARAAQFQAETEKSEAQSQRNRAEAALMTAEERRQQAEAARIEANQQRDEAEEQRNVAEEQRARAESQELSNRRLLYTSQMALANTAWNEANVERVRELLTAHVPKPGEPDLRGFEWHYLWRISHTELATYTNPDFQPAQGSIAFSSDGRRLITLTIKGAIKFWDTSTWQESASLTGENLGYAMVPAISSDKKLIASATSPKEKNKIGIWEAATGKLFKSFPIVNLNPGNVRSFAFSPDGKYLAVGFYSGHILIFDTDTGKELSNFQGHSQQVNSLAYSPDGDRLVSGSFDRSVKLWDVKTGKELMAYNKQGIWMAVAYSPDGQFFGAGGSNGTVVIWDAKTAKEVKTLTTRTYTRALVFSPDGKKLATGGGDLQIRIWDTASWSEQTVINGHGNPISALAFAPQGQNLVSGSLDGIIKVWDLRKGQAPPEYCGPKGGTNEVAFSSDSSRIILGGPDQSFVMRDIATGSEIYLRQAHILDETSTGHLFQMLLTSDRQKLITSGDNGLAYWDFNSGHELRRIPAGQVNGLSLSPDDRLLATSRRAIGGFLQVWDMRTGNELFNYRLDAIRLNAMIFLPDNQTLVTGLDHLLFVNVRTGQTVKRSDSIGGVIFYIKLSPDNRTLAVGTNRGMVSLHDAATGREFLKLKGHGGAIGGMAFSPDGKRLVSSSSEGIRLWDLTTGQEVFTIRQPNAGRLVFSPDGKHLAAVSGRGIKLYSTTTIEVVTAGCL